MPIQLYSATQSPGLLRTETVKIIIQDRKHYVLCSVCSSPAAIMTLTVEEGWSRKHRSLWILFSPTYFAIYGCWVTLAKLGGWQTKSRLYFSTDGKGRLGWINKKIWCGVLEWEQNAGMVLSTLTVCSCTFSLGAIIFLFSYLLWFCHV